MKRVQANHSKIRTSCATSWLAAPVLILLTLAVYGGVHRFDYVSLDDDRYITENPHARVPLDLKALKWAFTTGEVSNWHPLTWLSYLVDYRVFGPKPGGPHVVNAVFHALNGLLLWLLLYTITRATWPSLLAAALFAVHPLHVESVAWISERKDVLSTFFALLTLLSYVRYVRRPSLLRYVAMAVLFALALMSKPMVVTLPCALVLLDYWPLRRMDERGAFPVTKLVLEKAPLLILSAGVSAITIIVQQRTGSVMTLEHFPFGVRAANAAISYGWYLLKTLWPSGLAAFYPHPGTHISYPAAAGLASVLLGITGATFYYRRDFPYLLVGWLWFLGTLTPVIGLIQVGLQAHADRYMYLPSIGLFLIPAWGLADLARAHRTRQYAAIAAAALSVAALAAVASMQTGYWRNSTSLFERALRVTKDNSLAHYNLGVVLLREGRPADAATQFTTTIRISPERADAHDNLGTTFYAQGKPAEAIPHFREAIRRKPDFANAYYNLGTALLDTGQPAEAVKALREAFRLDPQNALATYNLGNALLKLDRPQEAIAAYRQSLRLNPDSADAHANLGSALFGLNDDTEAVREYTEALRLAPGRVDVYSNLGHVQTRLGHLEEAAKAFAEVLRFDPNNATAQSNLEAVRKARQERQNHP